MKELDAYEELIEKGEYIERDVYQKLVEWKIESARNHISLFLKGSRRVGKTVLALSLGHRLYRSFILISFLKASEGIKRLFIDSLEDLDSFYTLLEATYNVKLYPGESLIILDEVQLFPEARMALKVLLEDGRYDFIETGSLAGINRSKSKILNPSEEDELEVFPISFTEYLHLQNEDASIELMKRVMNKPFPLYSAYQRIMHRFREYMLVGGMPQAVSSFLKTHDFEKCDKVKRRINNFYLIDEDNEEFYPHRVRSFYASIPSELSHHDKTFILSHIDKNARFREYAPAIKWLGESYVANIAYNCSDPSEDLSLISYGKAFKCYLMDTGLLVSLSFFDQPFTENELYRKMFLDSLHLNEGMFVENVVAQCLRSNGHQLYFYERRNEQGKTTLEVDFLIRKGGKIIPIEVKSSSSRSGKSLKLFKDKFGKRIGNPIVLHEGDVKIENDILYLPYFFACLF